MRTGNQMQPNENRSSGLLVISALLGLVILSGCASGKAEDAETKPRTSKSGPAGEQSNSQGAQIGKAGALSATNSARVTDSTYADIGLKSQELANAAAKDKMEHASKESSKAQAHEMAMQRAEAGQENKRMWADLATTVIMMDAMTQLTNPGKCRRKGLVDEVMGQAVDVFEFPIKKIKDAGTALKDTKPEVASAAPGAKDDKEKQKATATPDATVTDQPKKSVITI